MRRSFPGISPRAYEHPADRAALTALRKLTGFDTVLKKVMGLFGERRLRLLFLANGVRVGPTQIPRLHAAVVEVCRILDIDTPETYVVASPFLNAAAVGVDQPFLVFNSSLVESLSDDELLGLVGHEAAHLLSGHVLYRTMLLVLMQAVRWVAAAPFGALALPILLGLREWERKSELSSDRGALLVTQDVATLQRIMLKVAGVPARESFDLGEFEKQARDYQEGGTVLDQLFKVMNLLWISHPFPVQRVLELKEWGESETYQKILAGDYPKRADDRGHSLLDTLLGPRP